MVHIIFALFIISIVAFILGMFFPAAVLGFSKKVSRPLVAMYYGSAAIILFFLLGLFGTDFNEHLNDANYQNPELVYNAGVVEDLIAENLENPPVENDSSSGFISGITKFVSGIFASSDSAEAEIKETPSEPVKEKPKPVVKKEIQKEEPIIDEEPSSEQDEMLAKLDEEVKKISEETKMEEASNETSQPVKKVETGEGDYDSAGNKTGEWLEYENVDGHRVMVVGLYKNGKREAFWMAQYENGKQAWQVEYKNGMKNGAYQKWYFGGGIEIEGQYTNDQKTGEWIYYNQDGSVNKKENL
ncbi:MAG: hypothetical protein K9J16_01650 [Melioribacteraceae bacterium]|nr:hypothetical protein [Melioribacteraceae bacterium]MCF8352970.1 hypothetical protein [Melioribacteraceae bacterium]MCF8395353.1 hypothetical protein [Melioribacteraceae bacterium]MCF8417845.1 hypothetical protein [Melioribacteraceae bacterium]